MRVLWIASNEAPYPDRSREVKLAEQYAKRGHEVHLVTDLAPKWGDHEEGCPDTLTFEEQPLSDVNQAYSIAHRLPTEYDAAYAPKLQGAPIASEWGERTDQPAVARIQDVPLWRLEWREATPFYEQWQPYLDACTELDHVVVGTDREQRFVHDALREYDADPDTFPPMTSIPFGVDTKTADAVLDPDKDVGEEIQIQQPGVDTFATTIGHLTRFKGVHTAIQALSLLDASEQPGYVPAGSSDEVEISHLFYLQSFTDVWLAPPQGGVSDITKFALLDELDLGLWMVHPPTHGGTFPLESVYMGTPVVTSNHELHHDTYQNTGVRYANPHNTAEIAEAIRTTITTDDHDDQAWDKHREWIRNERSWTHHLDELTDVLS